MEPVKTDQILCCDKCGVEVKVIKACDCNAVCNIVCCGQPMRLKGQREDEGAEAKPSCCG